MRLKVSSDSKVKNNDITEKAAFVQLELNAVLV